MALTAGELRVEVGAGSTVPEAVLERILGVANTLVTEYVASAADDVTVPVDMVDQAWLACAVELWNLRKAPNGVLNQQFGTLDGGQPVPIRISGDPLRPVRPLLATWIGGLTT